MYKPGGIIINGDPLLEFPRPLSFGSAYLGELGVGHQFLDSRTAETVSETLDFYFRELTELDNQGIILFSLGSLTNTTRMSPDMVDGMLEAFAQFPQYTIIWRLEQSIPKVEKYKNIHPVQWMLQPELLAHPKTKLFITHCGYNSLLETTHAAVPIVGVPMFADQGPIS